MSGRTEGGRWRLSSCMPTALKRYVGHLGRVTGSGSGLDMAQVGPDNYVLNAAMAASGLSALQIDVMQVGTLPRLASGKVDFSALREQFDQPSGAKVNARDNDIAAAFRRAFYPRQVAAQDSFETLGGDLLVYVQLSIALERALGHLPPGWEKMPVASLEKARRIDSRRRMIGSDLLLRAGAILTVVIHHATLWPIPGGAAVLMMLVGFGLARFQSKALFAGDRSRLLFGLTPEPRGLCADRDRLLSCARRGAVALGVSGRQSGLHRAGADAALPLLVRGGLCAIAAAGDGAVCPAGSARCCEGAALCLGAWFPRWDGLAEGRHAIRLEHRAAADFYAAGCALSGGARLVRAFRRHARQAAWCFSAASAAMLPFMAYWGGNWTGSWVKFSMVLGSVAILLYAPRIAVPAWTARLVLPVAAASYHIYLFHRILPEILPAAAGCGGVAAAGRHCRGGQRHCRRVGGACACRAGWSPG